MRFLIITNLVNPILYLRLSLSALAMTALSVLHFSLRCALTVKICCSHPSRVAHWFHLTACFKLVCLSEVSSFSSRNCLTCLTCATVNNSHRRALTLVYLHTGKIWTRLTLDPLKHFRNKCTNLQSISIPLACHMRHSCSANPDPETRREPVVVGLRKANRLCRRCSHFLTEDLLCRECHLCMFQKAPAGMPAEKQYALHITCREVIQPCT